MAGISLEELYERVRRVEDMVREIKERIDVLYRIFTQIEKFGTVIEFYTLDKIVEDIKRTLDKYK